jgi:hypothetical protein
MSRLLVALTTLAVLVPACTSADATTDAEPGPQNAAMDLHRPMATGSDATPGSPVTGEESSEESGVSGPPAAVVPDVRGLVFAAAVRTLWRSGIDVNLVHARQSHAPLWSVIEEDPPAGSDTPGNGTVNLVLSLHRMGGAGVLQTIACKPEMDELDDPYCLGKLLKY